MEILATDSKKILFVYPSISNELRIPLAISILTAVVRKAGHEVRVFDPTFMGEFHTDNEKMAKLGTHQSVDLKIASNKLDPKTELDKLIKDFKPDLICVSLVERNIFTAKKLLHDVDIPVLAGGIMPSIAPEFVKSQPWIDYVCDGEGEDFILDFLKDPKTTTKRLTDINNIPEQDWTDFDERHLRKPFMGKVYRGGAFELSRGCFGACTFCVAPRLRERSKGLGCYHRTKDPIVCISEIEHKIKDYDLNMVAFGDTDFLRGVDKKVMKNFLTMYAERIKTPFTMQCSVGTLLDEDILSLLRKAQCCAISVGVESGSQRMQKQVLKKVIPMEMIKKAFDLCRKYELRTTANYMMGLPYETEEDCRKTIELNRIINPPSIAVTFFTPFIGTDLYDVCIKEGFYKPFQENVYEYPPLQMHQLPQEKILSLVKEFTDDFRNYQQDFNILGE